MVGPEPPMVQGVRAWRAAHRVDYLQRPVADAQPLTVNGSQQLPLRALRAMRAGEGKFQALKSRLVAGFSGTGLVHFW
ncbi:hypothetical protein EMIT0324P_50254 [Pseudomonas chlororaphis]